jgi:hypothetical protein
LHTGLSRPKITREELEEIQVPSPDATPVRLLVVTLLALPACYDLDLEEPDDAGSGDTDTDTEPCPGGTLDGDYSVEEAGHLEALAGCEAITGTLDISCPGCTSLESLGSLTTIGSGLLIEDCDGIADLDGLSALLDVGGQLRLHGNDNLENVDGLANVCIEGTLTIMDNTDLTTCMACDLLYHLQDDCEWTGSWTVSGNLPDSCGSTC